MNNSRHSHHSPFGAFASFTLGRHNAPGGFGQSLGGPADQNVMIGSRSAGGQTDSVHAGWQRGPGCGPFAMGDQILSDEGKAVGSRYYPRGVTAWLWMTE